jgi:hypothetical protein
MPRHYHPDVPDEMKGAIESFNNTTSGIVDSFALKLNEQPPPSTIFHYTDDLGLRGIIEYGTLRLTDIFYLNDPSELRHGCRPAIELITSAANETQPEIKQLAENIEARLIKGIEQAFRFFTLSFSQDGDDLGQWRAYADNGRGYALGFDGRILQQAFVKPGNNWVTFPVCYSENDLRRIHEEIVHHGLPLISMPREKGLTSDAKNNYMHELLSVFVVSITHAALFFKHKAYSNEK